VPRPLHGLSGHFLGILVVQTASNGGTERDQVLPDLTMLAVKISLLTVDWAQAVHYRIGRILMRLHGPAAASNTWTKKERSRALALTLGQIEKQFGKGSVRAWARRKRS
jgi:hypothetical protein